MAFWYEMGSLQSRKYYYKKLISTNKITTIEKLFKNTKNSTINNKLQQLKFLLVNCFYKKKRYETATMKNNCN